MRVSAVVVVATLMAGCASGRNRRMALIGGGLLAATGVTQLVILKADEEPAEPYQLFPSNFLGISIAIGFILAGAVTMSAGALTKDIEPPAASTASPSVAGDARPIPDGMAGITNVVSRCGRALGVVGIVRVQVTVVDGRVTGFSEHANPQFAGCVAAELAAVHFDHGSKIDTSLSILLK